MHLPIEVSPSAELRERDFPGAFVRKVTQLMDKNFWLIVTV